MSRTSHTRTYATPQLTELVLTKVEYNYFIKDLELYRKSRSAA